MEQCQEKAKYFMCACLQKNGYNLQRTPGWTSSICLQEYVTPALYLHSKPQCELMECCSLYSSGLLYWQKWNNIHLVTSASFLLTVYSDYLAFAGKKLQCPVGEVEPFELLALAKSWYNNLFGNKFNLWVLLMH